MTYNNCVYIAVMAAVSYAIRVLPLTLIRKPIKNQFIQSFLYYVPLSLIHISTVPRSLTGFLWLFVFALPSGRAFLFSAP